MKHILYIFFLVFLILGCGAAKTTTGSSSDSGETLEQKNRVALTLMTRIRQLPGIVMRGGVPVFNKLQTDLSGSFPIEPLYVLNGYIVGSSFRDINQLIQSVDVKEIEAITGPATSEYGSRGGGGVIKITTYE